MNDFNLQLWVTVSMWSLPVGVGLLLLSIIVADIVDRIKFRKQSKYFFKLYKECIEKHGLDFAQKIYESCTKPIWIGMEKMIAVFEHHCR